MINPILKSEFYEYFLDKYLYLLIPVVLLSLLNVIECFNGKSDKHFELNMLTFLPGISFHFFCVAFFKENPDGIIVFFSLIMILGFINGGREFVGELPKKYKFYYFLKRAIHLTFLIMCLLFISGKL